MEESPKVPRFVRLEPTDAPPAATSVERQAESAEPAEPVAQALEERVAPKLSANHNETML